MFSGSIGWRCGMNFQRELETYQANLMDLMDNVGEFVVIRDSDIIGPFDAYEKALKEGYDRFGVVPFLVKEIHPPAAEPIHYFSRDMPQCTS
jgi:hypothetical protein